MKETPPVVITESLQHLKVEEEEKNDEPEIDWNTFDWSLAHKQAVSFQNLFNIII